MFAEDPVRAWLVLAMTGNLRIVDDHRGTADWDRLDPDHVVHDGGVRRHVVGLDVMAAEDACHQLNLRLVELFHDAPLLLHADGRPAGRPDRRARHDRRRADPNWVSFTYPFNLTRSPAGTVCAGFTETACRSGSR